MTKRIPVLRPLDLPPPPVLVDLPDWPLDRTAAYAEILDTHVLKPGTDRCSICDVKTPCPILFDAQQQLYRIGYLRSTLLRHPLRDLADHVRWLGEEIKRRRDYAAFNPREAERMLADIPRFEEQLRIEQAQLLDAAAEHFPDLKDQLPDRVASGRRATDGNA